MNPKYVVIVHTGSGIRYAQRIESSLRWISEHKGFEIHTILCPASTSRLQDVLDGDNIFIPTGIPPEDILIHSRAAHPTAPWMNALTHLENSGIRVINNIPCLKCTSDKWSSLNAFYENREGDHLPIPESMLIESSDHPIEHQLTEERFNMLESWGNVVIKPRVSRGNGKFIYTGPYTEMLGMAASSVTERVHDTSVIVQKRLDIESIFRVILIGGKPLSWITQDKPEWHTGGDWKVSVCLNRGQRIAEIVDDRLIELAKRAQKAVGGEINFVDIFSVWGKQDPRFGPFVISEINTACNLRIHELLAREAGKKDWNVHYQIAKYLVSQFK